ncbi:MAG: sulfotransferase [Phycisphaerales bacterium]|nr:sulfotransferase [Phycisphaerales bacterium]
MADRKTKIIYIVGCSRSGSTILDSILGSHDDVIGLGELEKVHEAGWCGEDYCGCGERVRDCEFWTAVHDRWTGETSADSQRYMELQGRYTRVRQLPRVVAVSRRAAGPFGTYSRLTVALYEAVLREAGTRTLVDSSKNPVRALALSRMPGVDLRLIHLVRDPRGVAASLMKAWKRDPRAGIQHDIAALGVNQVAKGWSLVTRLSDWILRRSPPENVVRLRYEDFLADPGASLSAIGRAADLDMSSVADQVISGDPIHIGHTVAGNRLRMQQAVALRKKDDWERSIDPEVRSVIERRCRRGMSRYGYAPGEGGD